MHYDVWERLPLHLLHPVNDSHSLSSSRFVLAFWRGGIWLLLPGWIHRRAQRDTFIEYAVKMGGMTNKTINGWKQTAGGGTHARLHLSDPLERDKGQGGFHVDQVHKAILASVGEHGTWNIETNPPPPMWLPRDRTLDHKKSNTRQSKYRRPSVPFSKGLRSTPGPPPPIWRPQDTARDYKQSREMLLPRHRLGLILAEILRARLKLRRQAYTSI